MKEHQREGKVNQQGALSGNSVDRVLQDFLLRADSKTLEGTGLKAI